MLTSIAIAATFSGYTTGLIQLPILVGLWKFKVFRWWENVLACAFPLLPLTMALAPPHWKGTIFASLSLGIVFAMGAEPLELWRTNKAGAVDIRLFNVYFIAAMVWTVFVCSIGDPPLIFNQSVITVIIVTTIVLWCRYRLREPNVPPLLLGLSKVIQKALP